MTAALQIAALAVVSTALFLAALRIPHWFLRSLCHQRLWRLRDAIAGDGRHGRLPRHHPAVDELITQVEAIITETSSMTMLSFYVRAFQWKRLEPEMKRRLHRRPKSLEGLTSEQRELLKAHREHLYFLSASTVLLGTWIGLATVLRFLGPAIREASRRRRCDPPASSGHQQRPVGATLRVATARASSDTWLGRSSRERILRAGDGHVPGVV